MTLPTNAADRKATPITTGVLDYFPDAIAEIARVSKAGNDQHNPGQPLHWDRSKSTDHADCIARHLLERGTIDNDGQRHSAKVAWRALALLQTEIENGERKERVVPWPDSPGVWGYFYDFFDFECGDLTPEKFRVSEGATHGGEFLVRNVDTGNFRRRRGSQPTLAIDEFDECCHGWVKLHD